MIERLPAIEINKPLAWTGGTYYGIGPMKVKRRRGGKRHNRKQTPVAAATPKKVPVLAFLALEADMSLPASASSERRMKTHIGANMLKLRHSRNKTHYTIDQFGKKVLCYRQHRSHGAHGKKRTLDKHLRVGPRTISAMVSFLQ